MAVAVTTLWLYLARRDQTGVRILARLKSRPQLAVRISDLTPLNLPLSMQTEITQLIYDERMLWEPWVESADTFDDLHLRLKNRGYTSLPINGQPEFNKAISANVIANTNKLDKPQTMLRNSF